MHYEKCLSLSVSVVFIAYVFRDGHIYVPDLQKNSFKIDEKLHFVLD